MSVVVYPNPAKIYDVETGLVDDINGHHGMPHIVNYEDAIGLGLVAGHSELKGLGRRDGLTTLAGGEDISDVVTLTAGTLPYPDQSVGEQMTLVSTNANDTSAGTGARTVKVHYIAADGTYSHETVTMNGTTPVNTVATDIRFVQQITVETLGTFGGSAAGIITIYRTGTATRIYANILAGNNQSLNSHRMIPAGVNFWLKGMTVSATSSKPVSIRLTATCDHAGIYSEGVFKFTEIVECQDTALAIKFDVVRKIPPLAIIKGKVISIQAGGSASIGYSGWVE